MSAAFVSEEATGEGVTALLGVVPPSAYFSPGYAAAQRALGSRVLLLVDRSGPRPVAALGSLQIGRLTRSLRIEAGPSDPNHPFWQGVWDLCRTEGIRRLTVGTYSSGGALPQWPGELFRTRSDEFVIDLSETRAIRYSDSHRRRVRASSRAGLILRRPVPADCLGAYSELIEASKRRREARGERVGVSLLMEEVRALLRANAGEAWFVEKAGEPVACVLFMVSEGAAYYYAAGACDAGLELGAPYFLVDSAIQHFRSTGRRMLNLGGVPPNAGGLRQFKAGFGSSSISCEYAQFIVGGPMSRVLLHAVDWAAGQAHRWSDAS
ncbi:MAG: GNAT family N-acetyltransferase [Gemmatimonadota bacterium]